MSLLDLVQQELGPQQIQQISQQVGADPAATEQAVHAAVPMLVSGMAQSARDPQGASAISGLLGGGGIGGMLGGLLGGGGGGGGLGGLIGGMLGGGSGGSAGTSGGGMGGMGGMGDILGNVLGRSQPAVQDGVQQASGLNGDQTKKLLMILAPIVLAAIMHRRQQGAAGAGAAGGMGGMGGMPGLPGGLGGAMGGAPAGGAGAVDSDGDGIPDYLEREAQEAQAHAAQRSPQIGGLVGKILNAATRH